MSSYSLSFIIHSVECEDSCVFENVLSESLRYTVDQKLIKVLAKENLFIENFNSYSLRYLQVQIDFLGGLFILLKWPCIVRFLPLFSTFLNRELRCFSV